MDLTDIANKYELDKGNLTNPSWQNIFPDHTAMGYTKHYEKYLEKWRNLPIQMMEIGIWDKRFQGCSIKMWKEYFTKAKIVGVDNFWGNNPNTIDVATKMLSDKRTNIEYIDMGNRQNWKILFSKYKSFDLIIEDAMF